jgi:hypothetical protein
MLGVFLKIRDNDPIPQIDRITLPQKVLANLWTANLSPRFN